MTTRARSLQSCSVLLTLFMMGACGESTTAPREQSRDAGGGTAGMVGARPTGGTEMGGETAAGGTSGLGGTGGVAASGGAAGSAGGGIAAGGVAGSAGGVIAGGVAGSGKGGVTGGSAAAGGATAGGTTTTAGGASATGGTAGAAGVTTTGGASGTGGTKTGGGGTTGGTTATGGGGATGGPKTGGTTATGGAAGSGGQAGSGGATGGATGCPVELVGWATVNDNGVNGTTGGGNATPTTVKTFAELKAAAADKAARVIIVSGTIKTTDGGGSAMPVASNKTIIGADKNAKIYGGIVMSGVSNVIIRNLNIQGTFPNAGPDDTVASHGSHHIWYDHLSIWDSTDGSLDITNASNYQTVSWTKFWYSSTASDHRLASLNGSGGGDHPEDSRNNKVTYHHNWWGQYVNERMPRVMYGKGHEFNNYFNSPGNLYCIGVGSFGSVLIENNYFKDVNNPHQFMYLWHMYIAASGNVYDNTKGTRDTGMSGTRGTNDPALNEGVEDAAPFTPPYKYTLDKAADVPAIVQKCAGPQ